MKTSPAWVLAAAALGCVPPGPADAPARGGGEAPFTCSGRVETPPPAPPRPDPPIGRLELAAIDPPAKPAEISLAALAPRRVRVIAEAVPLSTLAMQLAERLGVAIAVAADVAGTRITIAAADVTLITFFGVLASEYDVRVAFDEGVVRFTSSGAYARAQRAHIELTPIETRIIAVRETVAAPEVAATYCRIVAGPQGSAAVVGHSLVVRDAGERLNTLEEVVRALGAAPPPARAAQP